MKKPKKLVEKRRYSKRRPGMVKKGDISSVPHTYVSCGKLEKKILGYMLSRQDERFNIRGFSDQFGASRSTVMSALKRLIEKGFVAKPHYGNHKITDAGISYISILDDHRTVCREDHDVSYVRDHKFTFEIKVKRFPKNWKTNSVSLINTNFIQKSLHQFSKNNKLLHAKFPDDVDVVFTTTKVIIKPKNIFTKTHSEAALAAIAKSYEVIECLLELNFELSGSDGVLHLVQREGHYAEVNSLLSQFFEKHARGFYVPGSDGKPMFWVDHSDGHREDETASEQSRERLNAAMYDIMDNELPKFSQMAEDLHFLKAVTADLVKMQILQKQQVQGVELGRADYFG